MPNIRLKRYTGAAWENVDVQTEWSQILNKPATFTPSAHTHAAADVTSGTFAIARGGTGSSSITTAGGVIYYSSTGQNLVAGGAASQNAFLQATGYNGVHYFGNWVTPATAGLSIGPELYSTTDIASLAQNTLSTSAYSVSGFRFATVQLSNTAANTTTTVWTGRIDLTDTNQRSTTTGQSRFHRMVWNNGTSTFADNFEIYAASSSTIQFRHSAGVTFRYRITWER
jgi:hypothetical protein